MKRVFYAACLAGVLSLLGTAVSVYTSIRNNALIEDVKALGEEQERTEEISNTAIREALDDYREGEIARGREVLEGALRDVQDQHADQLMVLQALFDVLMPASGAPPLVGPRGPAGPPGPPGPVGPPGPPASTTTTRTTTTTTTPTTTTTTCTALLGIGCAP